MYDLSLMEDRVRLLLSLRLLLIVCCVFGACGIHPLEGFDQVPRVLRQSDVPDVLNYVMNCFAEEQNGKNLVMAEKMRNYDAGGKINRVGYIFDLYEPVTIDAARLLVVDLVNDLVETVNRNEKLKPYLSVSPFTEKEAIIRLRIRTRQCGFVYPVLGNIAYVSVIDGAVIYDTINSYTYDLDMLRTESFEQALKIVKNMSLEK